MTNILVFLALVILLISGCGIVAWLIQSSYSTKHPPTARERIFLRLAAALVAICFLPAVAGRLISYWPVVAGITAPQEQRLPPEEDSKP